MFRRHYNLRATPTSFNARGSFSLLEANTGVNYSLFGVNFASDISVYGGRIHGAANAGVKIGEWVSDYRWCNISGNYEHYRSRFVAFGINGGASAYAHLFALERNRSVGNHILGVDISESVSVVGAYARAAARLEVTESGVNAYAELGAKAYMVNARVTGGINIMGLQIGGSIRGYGGAVGITGLAGIRDGELVFGASAAKAIGGGFDVRIGFDYDEFRSAIDSVNATISRVRNSIPDEFIWDSAANIANNISSLEEFQQITGAMVGTVDDMRIFRSRIRNKIDDKIDCLVESSPDFVGNVIDFFRDLRR